MKSFLYVALSVLFYSVPLIPANKPAVDPADSSNVSYNIARRETCAIYFSPSIVNLNDTVDLVLKKVLPDGSLADYPPEQLLDIKSDYNPILLSDGKSAWELKNIPLPVKIGLGRITPSDGGKVNVNETYESESIHAIALIRASEDKKDLKDYKLTAPTDYLLSRMKQQADYNRLRLGNFKGAREYFEEAIKADPTINYMFYYDIACTYSIEWDKPEAIKWLRKAFDNGYENVQHALKNDRDLENIRSMSEFKGIVISPLIKERKRLSDSIYVNPETAGDLYYQIAGHMHHNMMLIAFLYFLRKVLKTGYYPEHNEYYAPEIQNDKRMHSLLNKYQKNAENKMFSCAELYGNQSIIRKLKCSEFTPGIGNAENLEMLIITGRVDPLHDVEIVSLKKLKILEFSNSGLPLVPKEIGEDKNLEEITINGGYFDRLPLQFGNLDKLRFVSFCNCKLITLTPSFSQCVSLKKILLANNSFTDFPDEILNIGSLEELDLSNNQIEEFPEGIGKMVNLRFLNLSNNLISKLPADIGKLKNLKRLDLKGNIISSQEIIELRTQLPECKISE